MIEIRFDELSPEDCKKLATLYIGTRKGTPIKPSKSLEEITSSIEKMSPKNGYRMVTAHKDGNIVGWMYYYIQFQLMTFINGFYPVVESGSEEIALELIEASKRETEERGHTRLEIELVFPSEAHREYSKNLVELYRKCGFKFAAEEIHMKSNLNSAVSSEISRPEGYNLKKFSEASYDVLEDVGFRILKNSKEGLFLSMSPPEQEVTLEYFFSKSRPYVDDASLILERDDETIGFIITRLDDDEPEIGPVGLVTEERGKGLASYLLACVFENLRNSGAARVYLDTTTTNYPAQKLYRKFGFEDEYFKQFYYWSP
ncbi:MAG: GNAT family N-acetyltransferase [Promethearchaeota archaeon]